MPGANGRGSPLLPQLLGRRDAQGVRFVQVLDLAAGQVLPGVRNRGEIGTYEVILPLPYGAKSGKKGHFLGRDPSLKGL